MTQFDLAFSAPPEHQAQLPEHADLVVIGGGVIGVMTAWFARKSGLSVVLLEKGRIACEQSSRNWGWVRQQGRHLAELPLSIEALRLWPELQNEVNAELGFRREGVMFIATTKKAEAEHDDWLQSAKPFGVDTKIIPQSQLGNYFPHVDRRWRSAMLTPSDGRAEPWIAVSTVARALADRGGIVRENCAVRCLDIQAGALTAVVTEVGVIRTSRAVLAAGPWSSLFLQNYGVSIPQLSVRATVAATAPMPDMDYTGGAEDSAIAWRKRLDGGYTLAQGEFHEFYIGRDAFRHFGRFAPILARDIMRTRLLPTAPRGYPDAWGTPRKWNADEQSPFERQRVLNPQPNRGRMRAIQRSFQDRFPSLGAVTLQQAWAGMIDVTPDDIPILDEVPGLPGLILATGMCGHGFGIGPAMGKALANMASGQPTGHDMTPFRFDRF